MAWCATKRSVTWILLVSVALLNAGCPSLNQWSGPSDDPFFSVNDPLPESNVAARVVESDRETEPGVDENGELSDQARLER